MGTGAEAKVCSGSELPFASGPRRVPSELYWNHATARWESAASPGVAAPTTWIPVGPVFAD